MTILQEPLVLDASACLTAVEDLDDELRDRLGAGDGDVAVSLPEARAPTTIVGAEAAALLLHFRRPETVARAVVRLAAALDDRPERILEDAVPFLRTMLRDGVLRREGDAPATAPDLRLGAEVAGLWLVEPVQVFDDSAVHVARAADGTFVALKLAPAGADAPPQMDPGFAREAAMLHHLGPLAVTPDLLQHGIDGDLAYLATRWWPGEAASAVAARLRRDGDAAGLRRLVVAVAEAYAGLHARHVLHGDVHPGNLLVDADLQVLLLDLGAARRPGEASRMRPGVPFYREPEFARAILAEETPPPPTLLGEQYAIAALLHDLLTGAPPAGHVLNEAELMSTIAAAPSASLPVGSPIWELGSVLDIALAREPGDRFPNVAALASALAATTRPSAPSTPRLLPDVRDFVARQLGGCGPDGRAFTEGLPAPTATVALGAGGVAAALLWLAVGRQDPVLLDWARAWRDRALEDLERPEAVEHPTAPAPTRRTRASLHHDRGGVRLVGALIDVLQGTPLHGSAGLLPSAEPDGDLTLGNLGIVLAGAHLVENGAVDHDEEVSGRRGDVDTATARTQLEREWALGGRRLAGAGPQPVNLGAAHGISGLLLAAVRWSSATTDDLPDDFGARLSAVLFHLRPDGRGSNLPWYVEGHDRSRPPPRMAGWCNGATGVLHLLCLHAELTGSEDHPGPTRALARHVADAPDGVHDLCCGFAGRAAALARLGALTGETRWRSEAERLVGRAVERAADLSDEDHPPHALVKGSLGLAVVADHLLAGRVASIPLLDRLP